MSRRLWLATIAGWLVVVTACVVGSLPGRYGAQFDNGNTGPPVPRSSFSDGTWRVGVDIAPGVYFATIPAVSLPGCYWQRLADLSGRFGAIKQSGGPYSRPQIAVTIYPTDGGFHAADCGTWKRAR